MNTWLEEERLHWSYRSHRLPCAPTTRYPDYLFVSPAGEHVVLLEVDENEHRHYNAECEITRVSEIMDSIDAQNLHVIRFNPHSIGLSGLEKRSIVMVAIHDAIRTNFARFNDTGCVIQYIGYSDDRVAALDAIACRLQEQA